MLKTPLTALVLLCAAVLAVSACNEAPRPGPAAQPVQRGFTTQDISIANLEDMQRTWNANSVRLMLRPNYLARQGKLANLHAGWERILRELPPYLDRARELGVTVILDLHEVPNERSTGYSSDARKRKSEFWADRSNLDTIIACWRDLTAICAGRQQGIWYDILNEPLDWADFPRPVRVWPEWAQAIIDDIRRTDPIHPVVVEVGPGGLCWGFSSFPLLRGEGIIYSTHQYQPHAYTHQGIREIGNTDLARTYLATSQPWPGEYSDSGGGRWDKQRLYAELKPMIEFQKRHGVRIYISETGVVRWAPDAARYARDNLELFEELGWDWSFHALHENPMWSPAHEPTYGTPAVKAASITPLGGVLQEFFARNAPR